MYRVVASCRLNGLAGDVNADEDPLLLKPFRGKPVYRSPKKPGEYAAPAWGGC